MNNCFQKSCKCIRSKNRLLEVCILISIVIPYIVLSGCNSERDKQNYENYDFGIKLEKPDNWDIFFSERTNTIILSTKKIIFEKDSARIEINGPSCNSDISGFTNQTDRLDWEIDRIRKLYNLESIDILIKPKHIDFEGVEVVNAIIRVPTISMEGDLNRIQVGKPKAGIFQTISIFSIVDNNKKIYAFVYFGNENDFNAEAMDIISSIKFICSPTKEE